MGSFRRGIHMFRSQEVNIESRSSCLGKTYPNQIEKAVFNLLFPPIKSLEKPNEQTPYDDVIQWFTKKGKEVFIGDDFNDREYRNELDQVDGLSAIISKNCKNINVEEIYFSIKKF